jgi:C-terminal processing protease CtpA/Prc
VRLEWRPRSLPLFVTFVEATDADDGTPAEGVSVQGVDALSAAFGHLQPGDRLVALNGADAWRMTLDEMRAAVRAWEGAHDSPLALVFERQAA